jgi:hypothetical protein
MKPMHEAANSQKEIMEKKKKKPVENGRTIAFPADRSHG